MFDMGGRDETNARVGRDIFSCGINFNIVWYPYCSDMLTVVNKDPRVDKGPHFDKVHTTPLWK